MSSNTEAVLYSLSSKISASGDLDRHEKSD